MATLSGKGTLSDEFSFRTNYFTTGNTKEFKHATDKMYFLDADCRNAVDEAARVNPKIARVTERMCNLIGPFFVDKEGQIVACKILREACNEHEDTLQVSGRQEAYRAFFMSVRDGLPQIMEYVPEILVSGKAARAIDVMKESVEEAICAKGDALLVTHTPFSKSLTDFEMSLIMLSRIFDREDLFNIGVPITVSGDKQYSKVYHVCDFPRGMKTRTPLSIIDCDARNALSAIASYHPNITPTAQRLCLLAGPFMTTSDGECVISSMLRDASAEFEDAIDRDGLREAYYNFFHSIFLRLPTLFEYQVYVSEKPGTKKMLDILHDNYASLLDNKSATVEVKRQEVRASLTNTELSLLLVNRVFERTDLLNLGIPSLGYNAVNNLMNVLRRGDAWPQQ